MKNLLLFFVFIVGMAFNANAQPPNYDDLVIYYADGDYEKLLKRAEKYTLKDNTKKDPIPYLYLAKANFEMSKDGKWADDYPKAFKDAIGYSGKCMRYDKDKTVYEEHIQFFTDLKVAVVEDLKNLIDEGAWGKMLGSIAKMHRFAKDDVGSYFLKAAAQFNSKDKSGGKLTAKEGYSRLEEITSVEGWRPIVFEMLRIGVIEYSKAKINMSQIPEAKTLLGKVKQWLEDDEEFMTYYDCVVNSSGC